MHRAMEAEGASAGGNGALGLTTKVLPHKALARSPLARRKSAGLTTKVLPHKALAILAMQSAGARDAPLPKASHPCTKRLPPPKSKRITIDGKTIVSKPYPLKKPASLATPTGPELKIKPEECQGGADSTTGLSCR